MKKRENISRIYSAALHVFSQYGYRKTTVEDIALRLGMTKGNLYIYVKNKRDLYERTVRFALTRWQNRVFASIERKTTARSQFLTMCTNAVEYLSLDDDFRKLLIRDPDIFPMFPENDPYADINNRSKAMIASILTRGIETRQFRPVDIAKSAEVIFSIYKMLIIRSYIRTDAPMEMNTIRDIYQTSVDLLTNGFFIPNV